MSPTLSVNLIKHYFGKVNGFPAIAEIIDIITNGVPVYTSVTNVDPSRAIAHANHSTVLEYMNLVWEKPY